MSESNENLNFSSFIVSYVSLSVIAGLFSYRLLNSLLDNIILPLLDLSLLPDNMFDKNELNIFGENAYISDFPNEDPSITSFLVPQWMNISDELWVNVDRYYIEKENFNNNAVDLDGY